MSIWTKLFGRAPPAQPDPNLERTASQRAVATRALLSDETSRQIVRGSLERLGAAGLRIRPTLDRDLIVVRCLRDLADRCEPEKMTAIFAGEASGGAAVSADLDVFWVLASETDTFLDFEDIDSVLPQFSALSDDALGALLDVHSYSIFKNAATVSIVNEHRPGDYVRQRVDELAGLAFGDFEIQSIESSRESDRLVGRVTLTGGQSAAFALRAEKRPDLTPFFRSMNALVESVGAGRFVAVPTGNDEDVVVVYLSPTEQSAFRQWADRQYRAGGPAPVDWFE